MKAIIASSVIFLSSTALAQVTLQSVVEQFTNTKCSVCASRNPGFYSNLSAHPAISHLSIHPSAPYSACVLSMQNKTDNDDRTKMYGIYGATPRLVINGTVIPAVTDYSSADLFKPYTGLSSPVSIRLEQKNFGKDSVQIKVIIKKHSATTGDASLFLGLAEDTVFVNGGNGETAHYNVLRKSVTGSVHQTVALSFAVGDSVTIAFTAPGSSFWDMNRIFAIAMLYEGTGNKLLQSGISRPLKTNSIVEMKPVIQYALTPNPADRTVLITTENSEKISLQVTNLLGETIKKASFQSNTSVDVSELPNGYYIFHLNDGAQSVYQKVLVNH